MQHTGMQRPREGLGCDIDSCLDCGALMFTDKKVQDGLKERVPDRAAEIDKMAFGSIEEYE